MHRLQVFKQHEYKFVEHLIKTVAETNANFTDEEVLEFVACWLSPEYFINEYCKIYDSVTRDWIPFKLWDFQLDFVRTIRNNKKIYALKARQMGLSWCAIHYGLWEGLFRSPASILIISRVEEDSIYLLGPERLRGTYNELPDFLKADEVIIDDKKNFTISRGKFLSSIKARSTSSGDGQTATVVIIDEADKIERLKLLWLALEPAVNAGGKAIIISKSDRSKPKSYFKSSFLTALKGEVEDTASFFVGWDKHPDRSKEWYDNECKRAKETDGTLDEIYENYPLTIDEALSPVEANKRLPKHWLDAIFIKDTKPEFDGFLGLKDIKIYRKPLANMVYVGGSDFAEGLPTSDYSTTIIMEKYRGLVVAVLRSRLTPDIHANYNHELSNYYNNASLLYERNNDGKLAIKTAQMLGTPLLNGPDGRKGYLQNKNTKAMLINDGALDIRDGNSIFFDEDLLLELQLLEKDTLESPEGFHDDLMIAYFLALHARTLVADRYSQDSDLRSLDPREW